MLKQKRIRFLIVGMAIALLAAALPLAALASESASFSGNDAYDLAAGGNPELAFAKGDDYEYVAQAGDEFSDYLVAAPDASLSKLTGDEFYEYLDADWQPSGSLAMASAAASFSGDDAYDPAAGGNPEIALANAQRFVANSAAGAYALLACDSNGYENSLASASGSYSGDDDYDPAAGGTPEQSVLAFASAYGNLIACGPTGGALQ